MAFPSRRARRYSTRREVALGLGVYAGYLLVRRAVVNERGRAAATVNARRIVALERRLGLHIEPRLQGLLLPQRRLIAVLNVAYVTLNVGLTVGWLIRLFRGKHPHFHRLRRAAVATTLGAQPVFLLFPVAPPRTLDHFVDTIADVSGVDLDSGLIAQLYDPISARSRSTARRTACATCSGMSTVPLVIRRSRRRRCGKPGVSTGPGLTVC